jgi:hypothetical protein
MVVVLGFFLPPVSIILMTAPIMPACSARSSTVSGASRFSRAQANSGPNRPFGAFSSRSEENCDWPPLRR